MISSKLNIVPHKGSSSKTLIVVISSRYNYLKSRMNFNLCFSFKQYVSVLVGASTGRNATNREMKLFQLHEKSTDYLHGNSKYASTLITKSEMSKVINTLVGVF